LGGGDELHGGRGDGFGRRVRCAFGHGGCDYIQFAGVKGSGVEGEGGAR
jgi:hypothetical protein